MALDLVEGWTARIDYQLSGTDKTTGITGAVNLAGMTVVLDLNDRSGVHISPTGASGISDATTGKVYFDPAVGDLLHSKAPYQVRWKVTDSGGKDSFFPQGSTEIWNVRKP